MWLAMLVIATVLVGCGIFFAFQNLGTANEYASIASFFLALLTAAGSALSLTRSKSAKEASNKAGENQHQGHGTSFNIAMNNEIVQQGPNANARIIKTVVLPPRKRNRRGR
jgi:hypothetical protein